MRRTLIACAAALAAGLILPAAGQAAAGASVAMAGARQDGWSKAIEVPGTAALNKGGTAATFSVSCPAKGSCVAGGFYADGSGHEQAFVVTEADGRWRKAIEVPGTAALNKGGTAATLSVSCAAKGSCAAAGFYTDGSGHEQAFVVTEASGQWRKAIEVPGTAALNAGGNAATLSVSCPGKGSCAAGGDYQVRAGHYRAFVVTEADGRWRKAIEVPGTAALNAGDEAETESVSCETVGGCVAAGFYTDGSGQPQAFVVNEADGRWRKAIKVPGTAALNAGGNAVTESVSCPAKGSCAAAGFYTDGSGHEQAFVVNEADGRWRKAIEVPGTASLNKGRNALTSSVSCPAKGSCAAAGFYTDGSGQPQAFVVTEADGRWRKAIEVPGTAALNADGNAETESVSCGTVGSCAAAGFYTDGSGQPQAFVVNEADGRWRKAIEVPGTAALNVGGNAVTESVSCAAKGSCAAGGVYTDGSGHHQAFVVSKP